MTMLRRRFMRILAAFAGAFAAGAVVRSTPARGQAPAPKSPPPGEQDAKKGEEAAKKKGEQDAKKKGPPAGDKKGEEMAKKKGEQDAKKKGPPSDAPKGEQDAKKGEAEAKKKKSDLLLDEERARKERLARMVVERHRQG